VPKDVRADPAAGGVLVLKTCGMPPSQVASLDKNLFDGKPLDEEIANVVAEVLVAA
jgi:hypothetical protein